MDGLNRIRTWLGIVSRWPAGLLSAAIARAAPLYVSAKAASTRLFDAREQLYVLLRDEKWLILVSFLLALALSLPGQIAELYRAEYTNGVTAPNWPTSLYHFGLLHGSIILICLVLWLGAHHIASVTRASIHAPKRGLVPCIQRLPILIAALPMIGCAYGLFLAVPSMSAADLEAAKIPGSIWQQLSQDKQVDTIKLTLYVGCGLQIVLLVLLLVFAPTA